MKKNTVKVLNLRHYCITVKNLEKSLNFYKIFSPIYISPLSIESGPLIDHLLKKNFSVRSAHIHFSNENRLELIENKHLKKKDSSNLFLGFHHVCFTVKNINRTIRIIKKNSGKLIGKIIKIKKNNTPNGKRANHCYIKDVDGNIIQLAEDL
jgi:predicted enzyme related to lactoylglutathione lyase